MLVNTGRFLHLQNTLHARMELQRSQVNVQDDIAERVGVQNTATEEDVQTSARKEMTDGQRACSIKKL